MIITLFPLSHQTLTVEKIERQSGYTIIKTNEIEIPKDFQIILHIIDPEEILNLVNHIEKNLPYINEQNKQVIQHELESLRNKIHTIIPHRHRRGLFNGIGTLTKWLFGTMDANDRTNIEKYLSTINMNNHNIIDNMNQQIKINDNLQESLNKIKNTIETDRQEILNKFTYFTQKEQEDQNNLIIIQLVMNLNRIKEKVEQIQQNIASARLNLLNPNILTNDEIQTYDIDFKKLSHIRLGVAKYNKVIIFAIKIPLSYLILNKKLILPISNYENKKINENYKFCLENNNSFYEYNPERSFKELSPLNSCILFNSCKLVNNEKYNNIMNLDDNLIIIENAIELKMNSSCDERRFILKGNFFINFHNCNIVINNELFTNKESKFIDKFVLPETNYTIFNQSLTFDEIVLKTQSNIKEIHELKYHKIINYSLGSFSIILIVICILCLFCKQKRIQITNKIQENPHLKRGGVTLYDSSSTTKQMTQNSKIRPEYLELVKTITANNQVNN